MHDIPADRCLTPQAFWRALIQRGVAPAAVLSRAGLPASLHLNAEGYVTTAQLFAIWTAVEALTANPGFGIDLVEHYRATGQRPALLAVQYAASFRDAVTLLAGFKRYGACFESRFAATGDQFAIAKHWLFAREPEPALAVDMGFASLIELLRRGTGQPRAPIRVDFAYPEPGAAARAKHHAFFDCEIRYGAPCSRLILRTADVDLPFPGHNPELLALLVPALAEAPIQVRAGNFHDRVRHAIADSLADGPPRIASVAQRLVMSERTLQRRIAEESTTFRTLVQSARREAGRRLLADPSIAIDRVAALLGYRNSNAFHRAFRAWEGLTPGMCRARNGKA
jgi:AraC-like DNA-binding protein